MKIIKPSVFTDASLVSSSAPEPDAGEGTLWNSASTYGADALVYLNHRRYRSLIAGNTNRNPATDTVTPAAWVDLGPTNRWAMFDDVVGTVTLDDSPLVVVTRTGFVSGLALFELQGRQATVTMRDAPGGAIIYQRDIMLDGTMIDSVYDWFFAPDEQLTDVVLTDLPGTFNNAEITLQITSTAGQVGVGVYKPGEVVDIGCTQYGASVGILDYSQKNTDTFGRTKVVERAYSRRANFTVRTDKADFNKIYRALASVRATPCVYIGTDADGYEPLLIYGFYKDFTIDIPYSKHHICTLSVEGLT